MESHPAPFMANLFLFYYEHKRIQKIKRKDVNQAKKFTFRFIDDLAVINDGGDFEKV